MKTVITILGRDSESTLEKTYLEIPAAFRKNVIFSDDGSTDKTVEIAKKLGIKVYPNPQPPGYGSNAKNCFDAGLAEGADIIIILHSDNQYDASKIPQLVKLIEDGKAQVTIGSRILGDKAAGMSGFRFGGNRFLTVIENLILGTSLTDLHSGLIVLHSDIVKKIPYHLNYNDYSFHSEIVVQSHYAGAKFAEVGIPTRYEEENQSISIVRSLIYGWRTLIILWKYICSKSGLYHYKQFRLRT